MKINIVLTGFMATGKTAVGRVLAQQMGIDFVDTDDDIESVTGKRITEIFNKYGVTRFRSEEALAIKRVSERKGIVIATGGGAVLNPENVRALKVNGVLVLLKCSPEVIYSRVNGGRTRPLLARGENLLQQIKDLMVEREEVYSSSADLEVYCTEESREEVASLIIKKLRERKYI